MKVYFYDSGNNGISFYRSWQIQKYLKRLGVEVSGNRGKREMDMEEHEAVVKENDIIVSIANSAWHNTLRLRAQADLKPLIIDSDDDITRMTTDNPNYQSWMPEPDQFEEYNAKDFPPSRLETIRNLGGSLATANGKVYVSLPGNRPVDNFGEQIRSASVLTTTTQPLADAYGDLAKRIEIIPNGVDFELWKGQKNETGKFRIGLFGSNTHIRDWHQASDGISRFLDEHEDAVLVSNHWLKLEEDAKDGTFIGKKHRKIVPDYFDKLIRTSRAEMWGPCEIGDYPTWLAEKRVDVILAPLWDSKFNEGKSNIKWLEATALGVPVIAADLAPYQDIEHGKTGLLAKKPIDYYKLLKRLYKDKREREVLAANALEVVREKYSMTKIAARYLDVLTSLEVSKCAA